MNNNITVSVKPINEVNCQNKMDNDDVERCWNCGSLLHYIQNEYGLVMLDEKSKPTVMPVELSFFCAQCGERNTGWTNADEEFIIMKFTDMRDARDTEFMLSMNDLADTYKIWSKDKLADLITKINKFKKSKGWK